MSPNRNFIYMTVLVILTILFLGGIMFGRVTKRVRAEIKNRYYVKVTKQLRNEWIYYNQELSRILS